MPEVIGLAILSAFDVADVTLIGSLTLATVVGTAVVGAATIAASLALGSMLQPKPKTAQTAAANENEQAVVSQALAPRVRAYGRVKIGGVRNFWDSRNGNLYQSIMMMSDRIDAFEEFWIADQEVLTDAGAAGGNVTSAPYNVITPSAVVLEAHLGAATQSASSILSSVWSDVWGAAYQLKGIAYLVAVFNSVPQANFFSTYPQSYDTQVRAVIRAALVWDPRVEVQSATDSSTWAWTQNLSLCILDYIHHPDGMNQPLDWINVESFTNYANRCDEAVPLKAGGNEPRYACGFSYDFSEDPADVLRRAVAAGDAELYEDNLGRIAIRGGAWAAPSVAIDAADGDILSWKLAQGNDALAAYNELIPSYVDVDQDYQMQQAQSWINTAAQAVQGRVTQDFPLDTVQSFGQSRRLAKIKSAKDNPQWVGSITTNLIGLQLVQPQDDPSASPTFTLTIAELGIVAQTFLVRQLSVHSDLSGVDISIISLDESTYDWDPSTEEGDAAAVPPSTTPTLNLPTPTNLTVSLGSTLSVGGTAVPTIVAAVDNPATFASPWTGLSCQIEYRSPPNTGVWQAMSVASGSFTGVSSPVTSGAPYEVRAQYISSDFVAGPWTASVDITATPDATAPSAPSGVTHSLLSGTVTLDWTNPASHFFYAQVFRSATNTFSSALPIGTQYGAAGGPSSATDTPGSGTWYYWIVALNVSAVASSPSTMQTVVVP
jgi:hypothetical protein